MVWCVVLLYIFTSCAVFWRARRARQNTNNEYKYIEDITRWREDMNFYVRVARTISHGWAQPTSEILFLPREYKIHIFELTCNVPFIIDILMTAFLTIFRRFPTTFRRFPKILQNLSEVHTNVTEHFPKISVDCWRVPKIAGDFRGRPEDVSILHQRI